MSLRACILLGLLAAPSLAGGRFATAQEDGRASALADLIVTTGTPGAADETVRIRITVWMGDRPWQDARQAARGRYLDSLFGQLDRNGDGELSRAEVQRLPPPGRLMQGVDRADEYVAFNFLVLDRDRSQTVSFDELARFLNRFRGSGVTLAQAPAAPTRFGDDLFRLLDVDNDRMLSREECWQVDALWQRDANGDQLLTAGELRRPKAGLLGPEFVARPLVAQRRFAVRTELPQPVEPDFEWRLTMVTEAPNDGSEPKLEVFPRSVRAADLPVAYSVGAGRLHWPIGNRIVEFLYAPPVLRQDDALRHTLLAQFSSAVDSQGELRYSDELAEPLRTASALADANDDGKLDRQELTSYIDHSVRLPLAVEQRSFRVTTFPERADLAQFADANLDGALGRRELSQLAEQLFADSAEGRARAKNAWPTIITVALQQGPFESFDVAAALPVGGPGWFARADRNRDGHLHRSEFLGAATLFEAWDVNGDGWLDVQEALRADRTFALPSETKP